MDTKFWGSSGWHLLHSIAYMYPEKPLELEKHKYNHFFTLLKDILPCKYCRSSISDFLKEIPIDDYLENRKRLRLWLYKIHNKVNDKLRSQGLIETPNPSLKYVDELYENKNKNITPLLGWDFIFSIVYNYNPDIHHNARNYKEFFELLGDLSPCKLYKRVYEDYQSEKPIIIALKNAIMFHKWFYNFQKKYLNIQGIKCNTYNAICKRYNAVKVKSCSKTKLTCRRGGFRRSFTRL